jgi:hypothetical protein
MSGGVMIVAKAMSRCISTATQSICNYFKENSKQLRVAMMLHTRHALAACNWYVS